MINNTTSKMIRREISETLRLLRLNLEEYELLARLGVHVNWDDIALMFTSTFERLQQILEYQKTSKIYVGDYEALLQELKERSLEFINTHDFEGLKFYLQKQADLIAPRPEG